MNSLLAKALRTDLNKSVQLSMKTVSYIVGDGDVAQPASDTRSKGSRYGWLCFNHGLSEICFLVY